MSEAIHFQQLLESFRDKTVLVLGDVMIDAYLWGRVERISPEAPVPVVALEKRENRLGGAANVALNLRALEARPILCSVIGNDRQGEVFVELMQQNHMDTRGIHRSPERITTTKFRVLGNNTQMLRVDEENIHELSRAEEEEYLGLIRHLIENEPIDVIIFQDYNKGVLTPVLISRVIALAADKGIPTCVDPKKKNFETFRGVTLFKPNLKEMKEGLKIEFNHLDHLQLESAVEMLQIKQNLEMVLLTLSEEGVMIRYGKSPAEHESCWIPAHRRAIADVSGAGDTVISVAALSLACGASPVHLAALANLAGGLVCEEVGVVPVHKERLLKEISLLANKPDDTGPGQDCKQQASARPGSTQTKQP